MIPTFLSEEWIAGADQRCASLPAPDGPEARLMFTIAEPERRQFAQVISPRGVHWFAGDIARPDVEIQWTLEAALNIMGGDWDGNAATAATIILEEREDGPYVGPPPPVDLEPHSELFEQVPRVAGATVLLACEIGGGPFGTTYSLLSYVDGQLEGVRLGAVECADVAISMPFRKLLLLRQGRINILEAVEDGRLGGSQGALAVLAGIVENTEYQRAMKASASGPGVEALAVMGEVSGQPAYQRAMNDLFTKPTIAT